MWIPEHGSVFFPSPTTFEVYCSKICKFLFFSYSLSLSFSPAIGENAIVAGWKDISRKSEVSADSLNQMKTEIEQSKRKICWCVSFCKVLREQFYRWQKSPNTLISRTSNVTVFACLRLSTAAFGKLKVPLHIPIHKYAEKDRQRRTAAADVAAAAAQSAHMQGHNK